MLLVVSCGWRSERTSDRWGGPAAERRGLHAAAEGTAGAESSLEPDATAKYVLCAKMSLVILKLTSDSCFDGSYEMIRIIFCVDTHIVGTPAKIRFHCLEEQFDVSMFPTGFVRF